MHTFKHPPTINTIAGQERRVGFEVEFSGISLETTVGVMQNSLDTVVVDSNAAQCTLKADGVGTFKVEVDWAFLKRISEEYAQDDDPQWLESLSKLATSLVPIEVVCPPIPIQNLNVLNSISAGLRAAGAVGTEESLIAAYGVHVNTEIPALDAQTIGRYLRAFCLLQWWLVDAHDVDPARKISPYIDLYPQAYVETVLARKSMSMDQIFDDYLEHNATRNRALDLLPLLAEIDTKRVFDTVNDDRVNARPAFHYRMPNCHIERDDWGLSNAWTLWCVVEQLAEQEDNMQALSEQFLRSRRPLLSVDRTKWVKTLDLWLRDHALV
ncbi:amidoligase family protein [Congregibacter variabilis]|uniref:Amidoligase family protein n=1 Tax=Congregibacter variabilis TaxID=3081200 RepID=A0ABZ0HZB8_9GAMM|nr:amidoligase family protein [Congregibacter sp. IMCC43200]